MAGSNWTAQFTILVPVESSGSVKKCVLSNPDESKLEKVVSQKVWVETELEVNGEE